LPLDSILLAGRPQMIPLLRTGGAAFALAGKARAAKLRQNLATNSANRRAIMKWLSAIALTLISGVSAQAYTCADVRALSASQQAYYIKVFNITSAQQERIRAACYGTRPHHVITVSDEHVHSGRNERDAREGQ
jgi:hypothetical protein